MFLHLFSYLVCSCPRPFFLLVPPFTTCLSYAGSYNHKWHDNCSTNLLWWRRTIFISFIWLINTYFYLWLSVSPMKKPTNPSRTPLFLSFFLYYFYYFFLSFSPSFFINLFICLYIIYLWIRFYISFFLTFYLFRSFPRSLVCSFVRPTIW